MNMFEIKSGKLCITDPCYLKGTWCAAWDLKAKNGKWICTATNEDCGTWGKRIKEIVCLSNDHFKLGDLAFIDWKELKFDIGVDSGQCGIFDYKKYPDTEADYDDTEGFYRKCCDITLGDEPYGSIDFGFVSSSGFGDGSYTAYGIYEDDKETLIGVRVVFIADEDLMESTEETDEMDYVDDDSIYQ